MQVDLDEFKSSLNYTVSYRSARAAWQNIVSKKKRSSNLLIFHTPP